MPSSVVFELFDGGFVYNEVEFRDVGSDPLSSFNMSSLGSVLFVLLLLLPAGGGVYNAVEFLDVGC